MRRASASSTFFFLLLRLVSHIRRLSICACGGRNYETVHAGVEISAPPVRYSVAFMDADIAISAREASSIFALATGWRGARIIIATSACDGERRRERVKVQALGNLRRTLLRSCVLSPRRTAANVDVIIPCPRPCPPPLALPRTDARKFALSQFPFPSPLLHFSSPLHI